MQMEWEEGKEKHKGKGHLESWLQKVKMQYKETEKNVALTSQ